MQFVSIRIKAHTLLCKGLLESTTILKCIALVTSVARRIAYVPYMALI